MAFSQPLIGLARALSIYACMGTLGPFIALSLLLGALYGFSKNLSRFSLFFIGFYLQ